MRDGVVVRAFSGRYLVSVDGQEVLCQARGRLKKEGVRILTGDRVKVDGEVVAEVLPRRTELRRPPVANVDQAWVVVSLRRPEVSELDLDRLLTHVLRAGIRPVIVVNKVDLVPRETLRTWIRPYEAAGFPIHPTSALTGEGIERLAEGLSSLTTVLAGPSGVGKSSLARIVTGRELRVGEVSQGTARGRHTTRWCELLPAHGGYLVDTPGFQELEPVGWEEGEVAMGFPEFEGHSCRFSDCLHNGEPGCGVAEAVAAGEIPRGRFERYRRLLQEVREWRSSHRPY